MLGGFGVRYFEHRIARYIDDLCVDLSNLGVGLGYLGDQVRRRAWLLFGPQGFDILDTYGLEVPLLDLHAVDHRVLGERQ